MVSIWSTLAQDSNSRRQASRSERIQDGGANEILESGKPWELIGAGYQLTADSAVDNHGNVYFTDTQKNRILKIDVDGKISTWKEVSNGAHGIAFGRMTVCTPASTTGRGLSLSRATAPSQ